VNNYQLELILDLPPECLAPHRDRWRVTDRHCCTGSGSIGLVLAGKRRYAKVWWQAVARTAVISLMPNPETTSAEAFERYIGGKCLRASRGMAWREMEEVLGADASSRSTEGSFGIH